MHFRTAVALFSVSIVLFFSSLFHITVKMQTTLIGYEIGRMKAEESDLLRKKNYLKKELADLTTRDSLEKLTNNKTTNLGAIAQRD